MDNTQLILALYENQMIKFGEFTLKSGKKSYIYADIRTAISYPNIFRAICERLNQLLSGLSYDHICGVPYSALTFASAIAYTNGTPMLLKRKEAKEYGTKKMLEGVFSPNQSVVLIEDVVTTGASILETTAVLEDFRLEVKDICVLIERNQGGQELLENMGYKVHSIMDLYQIIDVLHTANKITAEEKTMALNSMKL